MWLHINALVKVKITFDFFVLDVIIINFCIGGNSSGCVLFFSNGFGCWYMIGSAVAVYFLMSAVGSLLK